MEGELARRATDRRKTEREGRVSRTRSAAWPAMKRRTGEIGKAALRLVVTGMAAAAVAGVPGIAAAQQQAAASLASGTTQVVAQGVAPLPAGDVIWRVVAEPAAPQAAAVDAQPGFVLADQGTLVVQGAKSGDQARLDSGEASFVRGDEQQLRASGTGSDTAYFAIEIVPSSDANAAAGAALIFASEPFARPNGRHELDLARDSLAAGATSAIPAGADPTLILVTAGSATVTTDKGVSASLAAGQAGSFTGALTVTGGNEGGVFVAGYIGPEAAPLQSGQAVQPAAQPAVVATPAAPTAAPATPAPVVSPTEAPVAEAATPEAAAPAADDADGDGLTAAQEAQLNTDPNVADTDGDGLTDGEEVNTYGTQPLATDTDGDGIDDGTEVAQGTNPLDPNDPAPAAQAPAPQEPAATEASGGAVDTDGDGLPDDQEIAIGTDPNNIDTDADDLSDGDEVNVFQTGPLNPDTDGDGFLDGLEVVRGTDPNDPNSHP
jgi:thrombospondin type 3 repeat protein